MFGFVRYPFPTTQNGSQWWGADTVKWDIPLGCGYFGCTTTLTSLCADQKKLGTFKCVMCAGAPSAFTLALARLACAGHDAPPG